MFSSRISFFSKARASIYSLATLPTSETVSETERSCINKSTKFSSSGPATSILPVQTSTVDMDCAIRELTDFVLPSGPKTQFNMLTNKKNQMVEIGQFSKRMGKKNF